MNTPSNYTPDAICRIRMPHGHRVPATTPVILTRDERELWEAIEGLAPLI